MEKNELDVFAQPLHGGDFSKVRVLGIGGTTRNLSSSEKSLRFALQIADKCGATTRFIGGDKLPGEIYDPTSPDRSANAETLLAEVRKANVLLVSTPSYHGSISGHIKNTLDYLEDLRSDVRPYLNDVPVGIICCAMGWQAGGATLSAMRSVIHSLRGWPTPLGVIVNTAITTFGADYRCSDEAVEKQIRAMVLQAMQFAAEKTLIASRASFSAA